MIWNWIGAIICLIVALMAVGYGFYLTKEVHKQKSVVDYVTMPSFSNLSSESFIGWLFGSIIGILFGLFVGLFFKILPWWMARGIHFVIGIGFFVLGFKLL